MPKYIDADALLLRTSVEITEEKSRNANESGYQGFLDGFLFLTKININKMPAADVVEVVRCKDCKHFIKSINKGCRRRVGYFQPNDFCSYGERK